MLALVHTCGLHCLRSPPEGGAVERSCLMIGSQRGDMPKLFLLFLLVIQNDEIFWRGKRSPVSISERCFSVPSLLQAAGTIAFA